MAVETLIEVRIDRDTERDSIIDTVEKESWIGDESASRNLLERLTSFLITLDTNAASGKDFLYFADFAKRLFSNTDLTLQVAYDDILDGIIRPYIFISNNKYLARQYIAQCKPTFNPNHSLNFKVDKLVVCHIDTVVFDGEFGSNKAFVDLAGNIIGRGANDMKAQLAASMLAVIRMAKECEFTGDFGMIIVSDEESSGINSAEYVDHMGAKASIDTEATGNIANAYANEIIPSHILSLPITCYSDAMYEEFVEATVKHLGLTADQFKVSISLKAIGVSVYNLTGLKDFAFPDHYKERLKQITGSSHIMTRYEPGWFSEINAEEQRRIIKAFDGRKPEVTPLTNRHLTEGILTPLSDRNNRIKMGSRFNSMRQIVLHNNEPGHIITSLPEEGNGRHSDYEMTNIQRVYDFYDFLYRWILPDEA